MFLRLRLVVVVVVVVSLGGMGGGGIGRLQEERDGDQISAVVVVSGAAGGCSDCVLAALALVGLAVEAAVAIACGASEGVGVAGHELAAAV